MCRFIRSSGKIVAVPRANEKRKRGGRRRGGGEASKNQRWRRFEECEGSINEPIQHLSRATCRHTEPHNMVRCFYGGGGRGRGRGMGTQMPVSRGTAASQWMHVCLVYSFVEPAECSLHGSAAEVRVSQLGRQNRVVLTNGANLGFQADSSSRLVHEARRINRNPARINCAWLQSTW